MTALTATAAASAVIYSVDKSRHCCCWRNRWS